MYLRVPSNPNCFGNKYEQLYNQKDFRCWNHDIWSNHGHSKKKTPTPPKLPVTLQGFVYPNDETTPNQGTDAILHHGKRGRWPQITAVKFVEDDGKLGETFLHSCEWPLPSARFFLLCKHLWKQSWANSLLLSSTKRLVMFVSRCSLGDIIGDMLKFFPLRLTDIFLIHLVNLWESDMQQIRFSSCVSTHSVQRPLQKETLVSFFPIESWYIYLHLP